MKGEVEMKNDKENGEEEEIREEKGKEVEEKKRGVEIARGSSKYHLEAFIAKLLLPKH